jgi:hypothetical protein
VAPIQNSLLNVPGPGMGRALTKAAADLRTAMASRDHASLEYLFEYCREFIAEGERHLVSWIDDVSCGAVIALRSENEVAELCPGEQSFTHPNRQDPIGNRGVVREFGKMH